jgi:hypothetical protein
VKDSSTSKSISLLEIFGDDEEEDSEVAIATKLSPRSCVTQAAFLRRVFKGTLEEYIMNQRPRNDEMSKRSTETRGFGLPVAFPAAVDCEYIPTTNDKHTAKDK